MAFKAWRFSSYGSLCVTEIAIAAMGNKAEEDILALYLNEVNRLVGNDYIMWREPSILIYLLAMPVFLHYPIRVGR